MPTLNWIGKEAVVNHHQQVPFHLLKDVPDLACGDAGSGNAHTGTLANGATWTGSGQLGNGVTFDGVDDKVTATSPVIPPGAKSVAFWIRRTGSPSGGEYQVIGDAIGSPDTGAIIELNPNTFKARFVVVKGTSGQSNFDVGGNTAVDTNTWTHLAFTWDGTTNNNGVKIYVNGVQDAQGTASATETAQGTLNLWIGDRETNRGHKGDLDEIRIYGRALSSLEVSDLYVAGQLKAFYKLDEGSGTNAADGSGNGFTGTLTNGPTWSDGYAIGAVAFDGVNDKVTATSPVIPPGAKSVAFWMRRTGSPGSVEYQVIGDAIGSPDTGAIIELNPNTFKPRFLVVKGVSGQANFDLEGSTAVALNTWTHLAFTWDGTTNTNGVKIYVNGAPDTQGTATATETAAGTLNLWIGDWENNRGHVGSLDEVHIYGTALSAAQVQELYGASASRFTYDGDGNRIKKLENGVTTVYVNRYYEKNLTAGEETKHYFLGGKEVAFKKGSSLYYLLTDHLGSTSVITDSNGVHLDGATYYPFGARRSSDVTLTDKLFTGQRSDATGLEFYNARYYDAGLGRFVSPDNYLAGTVAPQGFNRYSYVHNSPLVYTDPSGDCIGFLRTACDKAKALMVNTAKKVADTTKKVVSWAADKCPGTCEAGVAVRVGVPFVGPHVEVSVTIAVDKKGDVGVVVDASAGGHLGVTVPLPLPVDWGVTPHVQVTNASSITDLQGTSSQTGVSAPLFGVSYITADDGKYQGIDVGFPFSNSGEVYTQKTVTSVFVIGDTTPDNSSASSRLLKNPCLVIRL